MKRTFSMKKLFIGLLSAMCFVCSAFSVGLLAKKAKTVSAATEENKVEVYQLAPNATNLLQSYVVKTAGGKLVVIDGGMGTVYDKDYDAVKNAPAYLPAALRAIAGKAEGEAVEVEAWFLSHAHRDHYAELSKIMSADGGYGVKVNNFYFDFPDFGGSFPLTNSQQADLVELKAAFETFGYDYDELNGAVINAESVEKGLTITVDGVHFDVLQTWAYSSGLYNEVNDTSLVIRMRAGEDSILFLNDAGIEAGERLTTTYTAEQLTSTYVQLGHHGNTGLTKAQYQTFITAETKLLYPITNVCYGNPADFMVDEVYEWLNGASYLTDGTPDASKIDKSRNFLACLYDNYPADQSSVSDWAGCIAGMKVASFDYEATPFEMLGASVRIATPDGIRFVAQVDESLVADGAKYGIVIIPADMDTGADLTLNTQGALVINCDQLWSDEVCAKYGVKEGYAAFSGALLGNKDGEGNVGAFPESFYNRPLTAVAFVTTADGETIYTQKVTRSIAYVATMESLVDGYESKESIDRVAAGATLTLSVNGGKPLTSKTEKYSPDFKLGGLDAGAVSAVKVSYTSDNEAAVKVVNGKLVAVADGIANVTATLSLGGEKKLTKTTEVTVSLVDPYAPVVLNDATKKFDDDAAVSSVTTFDGETCVKVEQDADWQITYIPFYNADGSLMTLAQIQEKYTTVTFKVYLATEGSSVGACTLNLSAKAGEWVEVTFTTDLLSGANQWGNVNYTDGRGFLITMAKAGTAYFGEVTAKFSQKLATPVVEVWEDGTAIWTPVKGATEYEYTVDGLTFQKTTACSVKLADNKAVVKVKALGDGVSTLDSDYSSVVTYSKKDLLNGCEYNVSGWVESNASVTLNATNAKQGYFAYGITSAQHAYLNLWLKKDYAPAVLANYEYIEMSVNVVSETGCSLFGADWATLLSVLTPGEHVLRIPVSAMESSGTYNPATGVATFWLGGAVSFYLDNVVGIPKTAGESTTETTALLNDCESVGGWVQAVNTPTLSTSNVFQGNYSIEVTFPGWSWFNVRLFTTPMSLADLQAKYSTITINAYSSINGLNIFRADQATVAALLNQGNNVITLNTANLTSTDFNGEFLTFWSGGAATIRLDNVVATYTTPVTKSPVSFGNTFILGDSYSTFEGWLPHDYAPWYTVGEDFAVNGATDVMQVEQTWWHQLLTATNSNLVQDCAYSGTTICNAPKGWGGTDETHRSFITRFARAVDEGMLKGVDTIFLYGGTNDFWLGNDNVPKGEPIYGNWTEEDLKKTFPALCYLLNMMKWHAPNARIVVLCNVNALSVEAGALDTFHTIANAYGVEYVDLTYSDADLSAGHPTVQGMAMTANTILNALS